MGRGRWGLPGEGRQEGGGREGRWLGGQWGGETEGAMGRGRWG